jgi:Domain of unknown function (DUF1906)
MLQQVMAATAAALMAVGVGLQSSLAADRDPGRIAIIDASKNTRAYLDALAAAGVRVIGRYYARCAQAGLEEKRLIGNPGEIEAILSHPARFGVLSIYQFYNNSPLKFSGQRETTCRLPNGRARKIRVTLADETCTEREVDRDCNEAEGPPRTLAMEAQWDAEAAVRQARQVRQPAGTAIYFGVDFNASADTAQAAVQYFTIVSEILKANGYLVGVYGNGAALDLLRGKAHTAGPYAGRAMVDFFWLSAARGHAGAASHFNSGNWDLFQTRIDMTLGAFGGLEIDTDVQNGLHPDKYIGFWNRTGPFKVEAARTRAIHDQRRFVCGGQAQIYAAADTAQGRTDAFFCGRTQGERHCDHGSADQGARLCFGDVTRVGAEANGLVAVDCDEDGQFDGWVSREHLSTAFATRPQWIASSAARRSVTRDATNCR